MRAAELLRRVPQLTERKLQYLGDKGYIKYTPIQEGEITRRNYKKADLTYIAKLAELLSDGLPPKKASQKAKKKLGL